MLWRCFIYYFW